jgi:hypothetical protein
MIFELRRYNMTSLPMLDHFDQHMGRVAPVFKELGIETHGAWNYVVGEDLPAHTYMLKWNDLADRETKWKTFYDDPRWPELRARMLKEAGGEAVRSHSVAFLRRASYWPSRVP